MLFRELTMADEGEIFTVIRTAFAVPPWDDDWKDAASFHPYCLDILGNANSLGFGLWDGSRLAALALGRLKHWFNGVEYCIDDLCVHPAYQGQGVGSALLGRVCAYARAQGFREVALLTRRNAPAYGFYLKNGFEDVSWRAWMSHSCHPEGQ